MSDDKQLIESTWAEARDLVKRLEGSSVQRLAVKAGEYEIEIERGAPAPVMAGDGGEFPAAAPAGPVALGAAGMGVDPGARAASGAFAAITEADNRVPVLAPLVGTYYTAAQPGQDPFVKVGGVELSVLEEVPVAGLAAERVDNPAPVGRQERHEAAGDRRVSSARSGL